MAPQNPDALARANTSIIIFILSTYPDYDTEEFPIVGDVARLLIKSCEGARFPIVSLSRFGIPNQPHPPFVHTRPTVVHL